MNDNMGGALNFYLKALVLDADSADSYRKILQNIIVYKKLYKNLEQITRFCRKEKITLVFCGYPTFMPRAMDQIALKKNVPLIDLVPVYNEDKKKFPRKQYFVSENDPHCTKEGYRIMADAVKNKLIEVLNYR